MTELEKLFAEKRTENGDIAYNTTGDDLLDILFMSEYYSKHTSEAIDKIGSDDIDKIFAMFIRDPRFGLGKKDLGVVLEAVSGVECKDMVKAGRFDDFFRKDFLKCIDLEEFTRIVSWVFSEAQCGNELAKKWLPRFNTKNDELAKRICSVLGVSQKTYRKIIKSGTVENKLSSHEVDEINFEHVPSLAMIKYFKRFNQEPRFKEYLDKVKKGTAKLNVTTTTVYDIYKNRDKIDADLFFDKLEKISLSCIPVLDTSGSMWDMNDSIGKAMSIAYYLAKCSTYCNNQVVSFSSKPQLIKITEKNVLSGYHGWYDNFGNKNKFSRELNSMFTGDCTNTNFGAVIELLGKLNEFPEYFVVLSDMEFDYGSSMRKDQVMKLFKDKGIRTKIVWWNFNSRNTTVPEMDTYGNIYMSGYSPMLLKYLQAGFNGKQFLYKLLEEYKKNIEK